MNAAIFIPLVCVFALACGCKKQTPVSSGHGHSHGAGDHGHPHEEGGGEHVQEAKTAQITVWSNGYEIFAEHTAPVVGQPARFITHVSDIHAGKARTEGMVKFVLTKGNESFDHPQARPERAGIYIPAITFPSPWRLEHDPYQGFPVGNKHSISKTWSFLAICFTPIEIMLPPWKHLKR